MSVIRKSVFIALADKYANVSINIVTTVILARLLNPAEIGVYSVGLSIVSIAHVFRDFGIRTYLVQEQELTTDRMRTALGLSILFGWPIGAALFFGAPALAEFYGDPALRHVIRIVSFNFVLLPFGAPAMALLTRQMAFGILLFINLVGAGVAAVLQVVLAYDGWGAVSMAWASLAQVATISGLASIYRPAESRLLPSLTEWRRLLAFGGFASLTNLLGLSGQYSSDLIIGRMLGMSAVGIYSRAQGLIFLVHRDIMVAIHQVALPAFSVEHRAGRELRPSYIRSVELLTGFTWPFYAGVGIMAEPLIETAFGAQWLPAAPLVRILALAFSIASVWSLSRHVLYATHRVKWLLFSEVIIQLSWVAAILLGSLYDLQTVCLLIIPVQAIGFVVHAHYMARIIGTEPIDWLTILARNATVTVMAASGPFFLMKYWYGTTADYLLLLAAATSGLIAWLLAIMITKHPGRAEISILLRKLRQVVGALGR